MSPCIMIKMFYLVLFLLVVHANSEDLGECNGKPVMVSRKQWNARQPDRNLSMSLPVSQVIIEHTAGRFCSTPKQCSRLVRFIQDYHMDQKSWFDIAYSFVVGGDARIYVGCGWNQVGTHAINYNYNSIGVALTGNYNVIKPTDAMMEAIKQLIECGVKKGYLSPVTEVYGHRDVTCTESPGNNVYNIIQKWKRFRGGRMPDFICGEP